MIGKRITSLKGRVGDIVRNRTDFDVSMTLAGKEKVSKMMIIRVSIEQPSLNLMITHAKVDYLSRKYYSFSSFPLRPL